MNLLNRLLAFTFTLLVFSSSAQNKTYLGVEAGVGKSLFETSYQIEGARISGATSPSFGFVLEHELNETLALQTGIGRMYYNYMVHFNESSLSPAFAGMGSNAFSTWQIPLRLNTKYNLLRHKIFFTTTLGFVYCINSNYSSWSAMGGGTITQNGDGSTDSTIIRAEMKPGLRKTFVLLQSGAGLKILLFRKAILDVSTNYYAGMNKVAEFNLSTTINQYPTLSTSGKSNGDYWNIALSLRYPISDIWQKQLQ